MEALTEPQIRRAFVNCSKGEANGVSLPRPMGIALRAADTRMSSRTAAMCLLCQTAQSGDAISLFTARRTGEAGRNGNTVGTYICADLGCARRARTEIPAWLRERDPDEVGAERSAELRIRVHGFLDSVLGS